MATVNFVLEDIGKADSTFAEFLDKFGLDPISEDLKISSEAEKFLKNLLEKDLIFISTNDRNDLREKQLRFFAASILQSSMGIDLTPREFTDLESYGHFIELSKQWMLGIVELNFRLVNSEKQRKLSEEFLTLYFQQLILISKSKIFSQNLGALWRKYDQEIIAQSEFHISEFGFISQWISSRISQMSEKRIQNLESHLRTITPTNLFRDSSSITSWIHLLSRCGTIIRRDENYDGSVCHALVIADSKKYELDHLSFDSKRNLFWKSSINSGGEK